MRHSMVCGVARIGLLGQAAPCATAPRLALRPVAFPSTQSSLAVRRLTTSSLVRAAAPKSLSPAGKARIETANKKELEGYGPPVAVYHGAMFPTLKKLKFFSLSSLAAAFLVGPFLMFLPGDVSTMGRGSMLIASLLGSLVSTAMIGTFAKPYVGEMRLYKPSTAAVAAGKEALIQLDTMDLLLRPYTTTVYDPSWLSPGSTKPFASWALAKTADHAPPLTDHELKPIGKTAVQYAADERLVAETVNTKTGKVKGRVWGSPIPALNVWTMRREGKPLWQYQVHDHQLGDEWQIL